MFNNTNKIMWILQEITDEKNFYKKKGFFGTWLKYI